MKDITYEEARVLAKPLFIDVRAPVEFEEDHIPGAVNMPLFDNCERAEIGKIYKLLGKEDAIVRGSEMAGLKIGDIVANIRKIQGRDIVIYCFRGGMRSTSLVSLLESLDFDVYRLKEGYKGYRKYLLKEIENINIKPGLFVLHGLTGTGKTDIIKNIENSVDLEDFAGHRSSVFGAIGLKKKTQKMFESLLIDRLGKLDAAQYIVAEGESRKIGDLHIPEKFLKLMYDSPGILIEAPVERRVDIILEEYSQDIKQEEVIAIVNSISGRLGKKNTDALLEMFGKRDLRGFTEMLLKKYYDPLYGHTLDKMNFIAKIENKDSAQTADEVVKIIEGYI